MARRSRLLNRYRRRRRRPSQRSPDSSIWGDISFHNYTAGVPVNTTADLATVPGVFGGIVVNVTWAQLQPTATTVVASGNPIDTLLQQVRSYNLSYPAKPLAVRLPVWPGINAPDWAKNLDGNAPVSIIRNSGANMNPVTVGHYWSAAYISAWRTLQQQLAALYDAEPLIASVSITSCSAQTDEPFVPTGDATSLKNLYAAGYNDAAQQRCLNGALTDYAAWKVTPLDFTFSPYANKDGSQMTPPQPDVQIPSVRTAIMDTCRTTLGSRCVLSNHAIACPVASQVSFIYAEMVKLAGPVSLQTQAPSGLPFNWTTVIQQTIAFGGGSVELWVGNGGFPSMPPATVAGYAALFTTPGSGAACP